MSNFGIHFSHPWLLLLFIPAIALTLIPYFRIDKRHRRTRKRVCSVVLHLLVCLFTISLLCGLLFTYEVPNRTNEIILLVDVSDSQRQSSENRDEFIRTVLHDGRYDNFRIGIVTFGYSQKYAVPLTRDIESIYPRYEKAELPDITATDVASALTYASTLFSYPETGKIVLVTDGKETDNEASSVIRGISAAGTEIDVAYVPSAFGINDVQISGVTLPKTHISAGDIVDVSVNICNRVEQEITVTLYDNGVAGAESVKTVALPVGVTSVSFQHLFEEGDLHNLTFTVSAEDDVPQNNSYTTYVYIAMYKDVLIIEQAEGDSTKLSELLENDDYNVTVLNIKTAEEGSIPTTIDELRLYDQIVLNNISNADLKSISDPNDNNSFVKLLNSYVTEYGGGLLTVGGNDAKGAHAYNRRDMVNTQYQQMLPVQAIDYTPPLGTIIIIDTSGSMGDPSESGSPADWALKGAKASINALSERDFVGVMTFSDNYGMALPLTRRTEQYTILETIDAISENWVSGGTAFSYPLYRAGTALAAEKRIDKRHIIMITDGMANDKVEDYTTIIQDNYSNGITMSVILIKSGQESAMRTALSYAGGEAAGSRVYTLTDLSELTTTLKNDLLAPEIQEVNSEPFYPTVSSPTSPLFRGVEVNTAPSEGDDAGASLNRLTFTLGGFYGVKAKTTGKIDVLLTGEYNVPIYAQWKLGKGTVGSFMCDLRGVWSDSMYNEQSGRKLILNMVRAVMPVESVKSTEIKTSLREGNYGNRLDVVADLIENESVSVQITELNTDGSEGPSVALSGKGGADRSNEDYYATSLLSDENNFSRALFVVKKSGLYRIDVSKNDSQGNTVETVSLYKAFSYSAEYDSYLQETPEETAAKLDLWATRGNGSVIEDLSDPQEVFKNFVTVLGRSYDPRVLFLILSIVCFLLDIFVRKFKFKWIHELIRERKYKK
ncbi:MAG: VWA domain-containing protein [Clostridia bacterium]|nr:VWA domain-containing protein [Clostridia bacterium]